jgi:hypothetical protein
MSQKSSVPQAVSFVSQVLKRDITVKRDAVRHEALEMSDRLGHALPAKSV